MSYVDLMIRIKNAQAAGKGFLKVPYSKMDKSVTDILLKKGLLKKVEVKGRAPKKVMKIYVKENRPIEGVEFISKPSRRIYKTSKELRPVKGGHGVLVVSTSKGVLSGDEAKKEKVGGQVLFKVW